MLGLAGQWLEKPACWLAGLVALAALGYTLHYPEAVKSTQALTLLGGAVLGQGAALWEGRRKNVEGRHWCGGTVAGVLILLLAGAAVWQGETGHLFQYRGQGRWAGPWDNPNTFGMLMGVGVVLAVGRLAERLKAKGERLKCCDEEHRTSDAEHRTSKWGWGFRAALLVMAAGVMGVGLVKSYSRGAWVGAAVGLAYLLYYPRIARMDAKGDREANRWGWRRVRARNWLPVSVILLSLVVIGFWSFRQAEGGVARRAYSVANANDFSWRKRLAAYEGALQMMAEKPWFGFGWNQPERVYGEYYLAAKVDEGMAIQLNDYLMLGMTLGVPALVCFAVYVGLSLSPKSKVQSPKPNGPPTLAFSLQPLDLPAVCRAGAVVLLVGFWFDGGLFKLATGATFWVLLELGGLKSEV